jgi:hypothetical protein
MSILKAKIRRGTTVTVVVSFVVLALSGLIMYFYPHSGPPAGGSAGVQAQVQAGGVSFRYLLKVVHEQISLLFVAASAFHIVFNWNALVVSFVKKRG